MNNKNSFFTSEEKENMLNKILEETGITNKSLTVGELQSKFNRYKKVSLIKYLCILVLCISLAVVITSIASKKLYDLKNRILTDEEVELVESYNVEYKGDIFYEITSYNNSKVYIIKCVNTEYEYFFVKSNYMNHIKYSLEIDDKIIEISNDLQLFYKKQKNDQLSEKLKIYIGKSDCETLEYFIYL